MYSRNKSLAIESVVVMLVLVLLAFVVVVVIRSGSGVYEKILDENTSAESARVAFSYINMKIKQNDCVSSVSVLETKYGNTLKLDAGNGFPTYIFFSDGTLYECITKSGNEPDVLDSNSIAEMDGFDIKIEGRLVKITCFTACDADMRAIEGTVSLRT